ncbi:protease SohB [Flocculibacter collagenilyticus]|uniref:protease SohB n=1 Tax=Flocculibacter collagenilyticus TaxID=2744479 RepID=UPI0018F541D4|nr:protease SohB [Flocculibacter collagenilyticus]
MEFLYDYGLFFAKAVTIVLTVLVIVGIVVGATAKPKAKSGELELENLSEHFEDVKHSLEAEILSKDELKQLEKKRKKESKKALENKSRLFVIDFKGSIDAHEVASLREEITALLTFANEKDEVLVKVESGGGVVHGYGLAASQLKRIKDAGIKLTVAVDKVAASGGYMMACVADRVVAAPFAILGSIGVIAQLPNFNKLLQKNNIEFEQLTAGEYKRTLTMFGENTEVGRAKFREELEETHTLFKRFVEENRPSLNIAEVATGEHWFGTLAKEKGLVDELITSDDYLMNQKDKMIFAIKYSEKKGLADKLNIPFTKAIDHVWNKVFQQGINRY